MTAAAQFFAIAVIFHFQTYGVAFGPLQGLIPFWTGMPDRPHGWVVLGVCLAFLLNMQLRTVGIVPLLWLRRLRLEPEQWLLLGGAIAGPAIFLVFSQPSLGNQYFIRSGFTFGVILSAWGFAEVYERARLSRQATRALIVGALLFAVVLVGTQLISAEPQPAGDAFTPLVPMLRWAGVLAIAILVGGVVWWVAGRWLPGMRGRGAVVLLTAILVAGAPGLVMDEAKSLQFPNGGAYTPVPLPRSRVDAARYVRDHSAPTDVVATNVHCLQYFEQTCDPRSFWLSAYAERSVLVEGWGFAPRQADHLFGPFWDPDRLALNDAAFTDPSPRLLADLRDRYDVRWLVVDRSVGPESPLLATYADKVYDTGRMAVYRLR